MHSDEVSKSKFASANEEIPAWKVTFHSVEKSKNGNFQDHFSNYNLHGMSQSEPTYFVLTEEYALHAEKIFRFQPKRDDVWVLTFPKSGKFILPFKPISEKWRTKFYTLFRS